MLQGVGMKSKKIWIIDDDAQMRALVEDFLGSEGYQVQTFESALQAIARLKTQEDVDLILSDIKMPQMDGMTFLDRAKEIASDIPVILITAFGNIDDAIKAIRKGAFDYIVKPFKLTELKINVDRALMFRQLSQENKSLRDEVKKEFSLGKIIGKSRAIHNVFDLVKRVAQTNANILVTGESGTGKELIARAIHELGPRRGQPFVAINCTAIPETLLESELFGHAKGSFTGAHQRKIGLFEEAQGGTIFLDEIGDMALSLQSKLLRVIQEKVIKPVGDNVDRPIDARVICATHKNLKKSVKEGTFREDLFYRLSVIPIHVPALRERKEDIVLLADHFLKKYSALNSTSSVKNFSKEALTVLMDMKWEGNVRELENLVERLVILVDHSTILPSDLPVTKSLKSLESNTEEVESSENENHSEAPLSRIVTENDSEHFFEKILNHSVNDLPTIDALEKTYIKTVLTKTGGRKEKAAKILGINRRTLYRKEKEYGLSDV